jgi:orotate phosphoribosyltransferase
MTATHAEEIRAKALAELRRYGVLMLDGHFDYGNGYHGRTYLNPHQLFRYPSTIWRLAQDLLDVVPAGLISSTDVVAGPATGGALLAHTIAGLLDSRRSLTHPPCSFAPFNINAEGPALRTFYRDLIRGRRVLLADDVRNTGQTLQRCAETVRDCGGHVVGAVVICDRLAAIVDINAPLAALVEYPAQENYPASDCPMCAAGEPVVAF